MRMFASLLSGLVFGTGLILSGMTNPAKVQNFLDVSGAWDPSLALVMGGAVAVAGAGFASLRRTAGAPLFAACFGWPTRTDLDAPLLIGSATFGVGWGLGGLCPGPAVTAASTGELGILAFVAAMLVGFAAARAFRASRERSPVGRSDARAKAIRCGRTARPPAGTSRSRRARPR